MAMRVETNPLQAAHAVLLGNGLDGAGEALRILVNEAAKAESGPSILAPNPTSAPQPDAITPTVSSPRPCSPVSGT